ncbi:MULTISPECIES: SDR family oxidoreductase [Pseudomonas syringae group]|nr:MULTISPECIES: SDR family oxidoreductase [Pseudomonas syringae group]EKN46804.1 2,3-butanediol dehydrogenase/acetoin (diacetyl) reductase [Pseudomonas viridiflava UASWS0038]KPL66037.1 MFS transporter [Pseudomonas viridiflava]KPZ19397.1 2,3-butanediol dehydrogenase/acetoin reductase [Pseudomonas viridiflava]OAG88311.1 MFS transporter [Pseudomonas viridiflava]
MNNKRFHAATVVITGACRGIGEGIAERFAREGANLVMVSNADRINETARRIVELTGAQVLPVVADVTSEQEVIDLYAQAQARFGRVDVSVQNAGIITIDHFDRMPRADFDRVLQVNTTGVWLCCREAAKHMINSGRGGRLINTSSGQGRQGFIYTPHYAASKMGVIGITHSLAHELAPHGITVNAFCPGIIESEMWEYNDRVWGQILSTPEKTYGTGELMAEWVAGIPMKRAGTARDVAGLVTFLASADAAYITGQSINVDGGLIMS